MKQFFKFMFASMLGFLLSGILLILLFFFIIGAIIGMAGQDEVLTVKKNSILVASLNQAILERTPASPFSNFSFTSLGGESAIGLNDILKNIKKAKTDENIKGIYLDISSLSTGMASIEEIRNALIDFKLSQKFIIAYGEVYSQNAYYLASVADKIYIHPEGLLEFNGMSTQTMFLKGALDKLGIEPQVIRVGTYKSAIEPLIQDKMSEANREQVAQLLNTVYGHYLKTISNSRNIPIDTLYKMADQLLVKTPEDALAYKMVDGLSYKDELLKNLKKLTQTPENEDLNAITLADYTHAVQNTATKPSSPKDRIALIYATGEILSGEGNNSVVGSDRVSRAIRKARRDDDIKAIVLRVNSPGGSALASDVIWREVMLANKEKPVVVSMGNMATSGGYYISCAARKIVAQPNTITGSIGVFAVIPNAKGFFNEKLGITFDGVKTGKYADIGTMTRPLSDDEKLIIQHSINNIYSNFTKNVAKGRNLPLSKVDSIAQGRVWSGADAVRIGLVDTLGGVNDALKIAANMAKIEDYRIVEYPEQEKPFEQLLYNMGGSVKTYFFQSEFGDNYKYLQKIKQLKNYMGVQMRMPFTISIN